jgi:hypothetical protein
LDVLNGTSGTLPNAVEAAAKANTWLFIASTIAAVLVVVLGILSWRSANKVQDAMNADAHARIAEARAEAARANERAEKLEAANLALRGQVATVEIQAASAMTEVAAVQKVAADAKATQQRVEIELGLQQERAAAAEKELLELKERIKGRELTPSQKGSLSRALRDGTKGTITVSCSNVTSEPCTFATQLVDALHESGWSVTFKTNVMIMGPPGGSPLLIQIQNKDRVPRRASALQKALQLVGFDAPAEVNKEDLGPDDVHLLVKER